MGTGCPGTGVTNGCEPLTTESSLQSPNYILKGTLWINDKQQNQLAISHRVSVYI